MPQDPAPAALPSGPAYEGMELDALSFARARMPKPLYPDQARRLEWEGDVTVSFTINLRGKAEDVVVEQSSGYPLLDQTVVDTVKKGWRFPRREEILRVWKTFSFRLIG